MSLVDEGVDVFVELRPVAFALLRPAGRQQDLKLLLSFAERCEDLFLGLLQRHGSLLVPPVPRRRR